MVPVWWVETSLLSEAALARYLDLLRTPPGVDTGTSLRTDGGGRGGDAGAGGTTSVCCRAIGALGV